MASYGDLFLALCISRYLDLQTALTETGRRIAFLEGWYDQHQDVQLAIVALIAISFIVVEVSFLIWSRNVSLSASATLAIMGATFVVTFLMVRSVSFHSADQFIGKQIIPGLRVNWILQLGGIGVVLFASEWHNKFWCSEA